MEMKEFARQNFDEAAAIVKEVTQETKLIYSEFLTEKTGNEVYIKPENLQRTGAYKVRGAYYTISQLSEEDKQKGLVTASAGNHAQGVAYAAKLAGIPATIVMPTTTPLIKVNRTKKLGANVVLHGDVFDQAMAHAYKLAEENGYTLVHPFNDLRVATGQGSIAKEILDELPDADIILVPVGGGGLCTGISTYAKMLNPNVKVIAVEPAGAACLNAALQAGEVVTVSPINTIADGTAVQTLGDKLLPYIKENIDDIILIEDSELAQCFLELAENHKIIAENSGLLTIAALSHLDCKGKKVVPVISGGNMDVLVMANVVLNGLIQRDRIFTVSVMVQDKPGKLAALTALLGQNQANIIKLDHNVFANVNRAAGVQVVCTLEAFGTEHKEQIIEALEKEGFCPKLEKTSNIYM